MSDQRLRPGATDALVVVDLQVDFLPGGALAVPEADRVVPVMNCYIDCFHKAGLPIFASRDWHPANHCSFVDQGGPWPVHCVADSPGAQFATALRLPESVVIVSKATLPDREAYSALDGTELIEQLRQRQIRRLFIGGVATDYCVLHTVNDARQAGFEVVLLRDAIRAVDAEAGERAYQQMLANGAVPATCEQLCPA